MADNFIKAVIGGAVYDVAADIIERATSRLGVNLDPDIVTIIAAWYLARRYPGYAEYLKGVAAAAASRVISVGGLFAAEAGGGGGTGGVKALRATAQPRIIVRNGWGRILTAVR